jgi:hypothetical protein
MKHEELTKDLNITGLELALLLNFKEATLTWKRVVRGAREDDHGLHR